MGSLHEAVRAELLASVCAAACRVFDAPAASVALLDERTGELVFAAVAGEGADDLVGARFPADEGIAGQVLRTGEPIDAADLSHEPRFARSVAVETGFEPESISVAPLRDGDGKVVGVLSVLETSRRPALGPRATLEALAEHAQAAMTLAATVSR